MLTMETSLLHFPIASVGQLRSTPPMNESYSPLRSNHSSRNFRTSWDSGYTLLANDRGTASGAEETRTRAWRVHQKKQWTAFTSMGTIRTCGSAGLVKRNLGGGRLCGIGIGTEWRVARRIRCLAVWLTADLPIDAFCSFPL